MCKSYHKNNKTILVLDADIGVEVRYFTNSVLMSQRFYPYLTPGYIKYFEKFLG